MRYYDVTRLLTSEMPVWPGADHPKLTVHKTMPERSCKESSFSLNLHNGTHMDAPGHFIQEGKSVQDLPVERFAGKVSVIARSGDEHVDVSFLKEKEAQITASKVIFKTRNSNVHDRFDEQYVAIDPEAAQFLVDKGVDLVGVDGPSVEIYGSKSKGTHTTLLKNDVIIVEGLDMREVPEGDYEFFAFPMKIKDAEGAPVRAVLRSL